LAGDRNECSAKAVCGCGSSACRRDVTAHGDAEATAADWRKTILEDTLQNVCGSNIGEIILVLGHGADDIQKTIATENLKVVVNPDYQQGMGTSLRSGLAAVSTDATAALIVLADQPWVTAETLNSLIVCHQSESRRS
jgi:CTP:molybdopterin cytidylyltransferase MocA